MQLKAGIIRFCLKLIFICIILFGCLFTQNHAKGQEVEHNYLVGPQVVTCDSLELASEPLEERLSMIRSAKYRFDQSFRLTRKTGLQQGEYYSCDNLTGYLIIKYDDTFYLYMKVKKNLWDQMLSSSDPEGHYLRYKEQLIEVQ